MAGAGVSLAPVSQSFSQVSGLSQRGTLTLILNLNRNRIFFYF